MIPATLSLSFHRKKHHHFNKQGDNNHRMNMASMIYKHKQTNKQIW